ncbi:hypothetical protein FRC05_007203 [Tulasnella sp. 425]|nr:hypothetical protein FRC05_007203 [Tulasnella sp. 425]
MRQVMINQLPDLCAHCIDSGGGHSHIQKNNRYHTFRVEYGVAPDDKLESLEPIVPLQKLSHAARDAVISDVQKEYSHLRFSRNNTGVGVVSSLVLIMLTHGTSFFGLIYSGPKLGYTIWKIRKLKKLMKKHGIAKPDMRYIELLVPLAIGVVVGGFGLAVDGLPEAADAASHHPGPDVNMALSPEEFVAKVYEGATKAVQEFGSAAVTPPPDALHVAIGHASLAWNPTPLDTPSSEVIGNHVHNGGEKLHKLGESVQRRTVFNEQNAEAIGNNLMAVYLSELVSKGIVKATRGATKASRNEATSSWGPSKPRAQVDAP